MRTIPANGSSLRSFPTRSIHNIGIGWGRSLAHYLRAARRSRCRVFTERCPPTRTRLRYRDSWQMYLKTGVSVTWLAASYVLLVFFTSHWWMAFPFAVSLGLAMAGVGFNIQHDGGHRAYSKYNWVNRMMAMALDLM